MAQKVLCILLCVGVVSLVSGCYCYPIGAYPGSYRHHAYRYSSVSPVPSYTHHATETYGGG